MYNKMVECKNVVYQYKNEDESKNTTAVNDVTLEVNEGEFLVILGRNGSGKSTLAKHLNALLVPTDGKVIVEGLDTSNEEDVWTIRSKTGMVFQNPDRLY